MPVTLFPSTRRVPEAARSYTTSETSSASPTTTAPLTPVHEDLDRERLYTEFMPLMRRLIRQYGQHQEMQEDLRGELYCRFCALLEAFDPNRGVPLRPYLVRQLTLAAYTYARQQWRICKRETVLEDEGSYAQQVIASDPTGDWLAALAQDEVAKLLPSALENLSTRQRNVVIWRYYEERSFEEIAETLGVQPSSVRSLLRHALTNIRQALFAVGYT